MENTAPRKRGRPTKAESEQRAALKAAAEKKASTAKKASSVKNVSSRKKDVSEKKAEKKPTLKPQGSLVFGLDIGTRTVVGIIGEMVDDCFCVRDIEVAAHPKRAMIDGQIDDIEQVGKIVSKVKTALEKRNSVKLSRVSIAAAGRALHTKRVKMEFDVENKDILSEENVKSMEIEAVQLAQKQLDDESEEKSVHFYCVGHSVVTYKLDDYKILKLDGHKGKKAEVELIAAFLPSIVVESLYAVMDRQGLEVCSLTLEPIAAMNVLVPPEIRLINIALVDIGAGTSDIAIARDGSIVAYAMATTAGDEITEQIIKKFLVDFNTAEQMKMSCSSGEIEYRDIFMMQRKITSEELYEKISPAVEELAETISKSIVEANGESPQAVFLVGGGSRVNGLTKLIADKLSVDDNRIAVGGNDFLKNVTIDSGEKLGPEFVTPIGIGLTATMNQSYDFSVITLNGEKIRIFNTKEMSIFELLSFAGYKSSQLMGRSGTSITYHLNGVKGTVKGKMQTPAEIYVNGTLASLNAKVTQGDEVKIVPAKNGKDAALMLSELVKLNGGKVTFIGSEHYIGTVVTVNGEPVHKDRNINNLDVIKTQEIKTIADLMATLDISMSLGFSANGTDVGADYTLKDGDAIAVNENSTVADVKPFEPIVEAPAAIPAEVPIAEEPDVQPNDTEITLNGEYLCLKAKENGEAYMFVDLLNLVKIDQNALQNGNVTMLHNSRVARFSEELKSGDSCIIK